MSEFERKEAIKQYYKIHQDQLEEYGVTDMSFIYEQTKKSVEFHMSMIAERERTLEKIRKEPKPEALKILNKGKNR